MALKFRRGTTAQQSGSLQFGEPFVNTTLGTLVIGGASGDIVLSAGGTGSTGNFGPISGSGLNITGNAKIDGNLTLGGNITIGDNTSDSVNVVASLSSSLIPSNDNAFDLGSSAKMWRDLYISTASIKMVDPTTNQVVTTINGIPGGGIQIGNIQITTGSINVVDANGTITQQVANSSSAGVAQIYATTGSFNSYTQSANSRLGSLEAATSSYANSASVASAIATSVSASDFGQTLLSASIASLDNTQGTNITTNSASAAGAFASASAYSSSAATALNTLSGSIATTNNTQTDNITTATQAAAGAFASASAYSGSAATTYAKLGTSNTFTGTQIITGSLYVTTDLIVQGSSSLQNITASAVSIGTNTIILNTDTPAVRFSGIVSVDSGSTGGSGSFLYDSVLDEFIFVHRGDGTNVTSSVFLVGPATYNDLGNETYPTTNSLLKGGGREHVANSNITDSGTLVNIVSATQITGSLGVSGSIGVVGDLTINGTSYSAATSGTAGAQGPQGNQGPQGTNGTIGTNGAQGNQGPTGPQGFQGRQGDIGPQGFQGRQGDIGPQGFQGRQGPQGNQGPTGANGTNGGTGPTGPTGPSGNPFGGGTFTGGIAVQGAITATGDITAYSSDDRLKVRIGNIENALSKVQQLNGFHYTNSDVAKSLGYTTDESQVGVSAQEVQSVLPEVVVLAPIDRLVLESGEIISKSGENYLTVKYEKIVPLIIEAIKELKAELDELKSK